MKTFKRLDLQLKAFIIATLLITTIMLAMVQLYGFSNF